MSVKLEIIYQLWMGDGDRIEVGPDRDGLGLIEIRSFDGSKLETAILLDKELAKQVSECLLRVLHDMEEK